MEALWNNDATWRKKLERAVWGVSYFWHIREAWHTESLPSDGEALRLHHTGPLATNYQD